MTLADALAAPVATFLTWRMILCTGEEESAVQDGARALYTRALGPDGGGFRGLDTEGSQRELAISHLITPPLGGGTPVLRLRGISDRHGKLMAELAGIPGEFLVVAEGVGLSPRSLVVKALGGMRHATVVGCERDGPAMVRTALASRGCTAEPEALRLAGALAAQPGWGSFAGQLALLAEPGQPVTPDVVLRSAGSGDPDTDADRMWGKALAGSATATLWAEALLSAGTTPISVIRAGVIAVHRLRALQTPGMQAWIPNQLEADLRAAGRCWPRGAVALGKTLTDAERACKSGRDDPALVLITVIQTLAARARQAGINSRTKPSS